MTILYEIIEYLNQQLGKKCDMRYQDTTIIQTLINEGYRLDDFKSVIDKKIKSWKGTEWEQYLRPSTLFGKNFIKYLNEPDKRNPKNRIQQLSDTVNKAKQHDWKLGQK
jgi:uncharacterized phage protein (TIGR02220 family)